MITELEIQKLKEEAKSDNREAIYALGKIYLNGIGVQQNIDEGWKYITEAAEDEYPLAVKLLAKYDPKRAFPIIKRMYECDDADGIAFGLLAQYYFLGQYVEQDYNEGLRLLEIAVHKGDIDSMFKLGEIYEYCMYGIKEGMDLDFSYYDLGIRSIDGDICALHIDSIGFIKVEIDEWLQVGKNAFEYFKKHTELGNMRYERLGTCYKYGIGTSADAVEALNWYAKAAEDGEETAYEHIYELFTDDVCCDRDYKSAVEWMEKGDKMGIAKCTYLLSMHYETGVGIEQNLEKMLYCLHRYVANERFDCNECVKIANCYRYGKGTDIDFAKAYKWYTEAAERNKFCRIYLGECYEKGIGVRKNKKKAFENYKISALDGNSIGQFHLANCYRNGIGVKQDFSKAFEWYSKAAKNYTPAKYELGLMYYNGVGIDVDMDKAIKYISFAACSDYEPAIVFARENNIDVHEWKVDYDCIN